MIFTSVIFLFYFLPIFFIIYFSVPYKFKNYILLFFSILFYIWGAPKFLFVLITSCIIDYFLVKEIEIKKSKILLTIGILLNVFLLVYFKYSNFIVDNINYLSNIFGLQPIIWKNVILPLAISFFTFRKIAYLVDVYKDEAKPFNSIYDYLLFILFFPQLISGPITRYKEIHI